MAPNGKTIELVYNAVDKAGKNTGIGLTQGGNAIGQFWLHHRHAGQPGIRTSGRSSTTTPPGTSSTRTTHGHQRKQRDGLHRLLPA